MHCETHVESDTTYRYETASSVIRVGKLRLKVHLTYLTLGANIDLSDINYFAAPVNMFLFLWCNGSITLK